MTRPSAFHLDLPVTPPLDPDFLPAALVRRNYQRQVQDCDHPVTLHLAIERENGCVYRDMLALLPPNPITDTDTLQIVERHLKTLLWAYGGWRILLHGDEAICRDIAERYRPGGTRDFDVNLMQQVYDQTFCVERRPLNDLPETRDAPSQIGGHLDGCRVGFDLGASDYKLAAVQDGEAVFSTEIPWNPASQTDPDYHYQRILEGIRSAASHLPRLDAVGGSAAGIYIDNQVKVASLFRSVPPERFKRDVQPMFKRLQHELGVPLTVANDGDVTALAGALSLNRHAMLGVAMGSSEAAGYLDPAGRLRGYLNELAFVPVDFQTEAAMDDWSGDTGVGSQYFSQQAVNRLAIRAGFDFPKSMPLPERLITVQDNANSGDPNAQRVFETLGVYLGYSLPYYADYYRYHHVLILGRVMSGTGGEIILREARRVLDTVFPAFTERTALTMPDEAARRVGQAVAAASLPKRD